MVLRSDRDVERSASILACVWMLVAAIVLAAALTLAFADGVASPPVPEAASASLDSSMAATAIPTPSGGGHRSEGDPVSPGSITGVILFDSRTAAPLTGIDVLCAMATDDTRAPGRVRSDEIGQLKLHPGLWRIDASAAGFGPKDVEVRVTAGMQILWLQPMARLVVRVLGANRQAIPGALVTLCRDGDVAGESKRSGDDGCVDLGRMPLDQGWRVLVTHGTHEPASVGIDVVPIRSEPEHLVEVVLRPSTRSWTLAVCDVDGLPVAGATFSVSNGLGSVPAIPIGTTRSDGTLAVAGDWMFDDCRWMFSGRAYDFRLVPPRPGDDQVPDVVTVTVPRRSEGTLSIVGSARGELRVRLLAASPGANGEGLLTRSMAGIPVGRHSTSLPAKWPIVVQCLVDGALLAEQTVQVDADGWSVPITLDSPPARRVLHLRSPEVAFEKVECEGEVLYARQSAFSAVPPVPVHALAVEVTRGHATVQVTFLGGAKAMIVGSPGQDDAVVTCGPVPSLVPTQFVMQDAVGRPLVDVVVRATRRTQSELAATDAPGWLMMSTGNVFRLQPGPDGIVRTELPTGQYEVEVALLVPRDSFGGSWPAVGQREVEVLAPGPARFVLQAPRPRRVRIELLTPQGRPAPGFWKLIDGILSAEFGGDSCEVWLTEEAREVRVVDRRGRLLGAAQVTAGSDPVTVKVPITEPQ